MAEYEMRAMVESEDKYTFLQSSQISGQCGLIGHLRADMDTNGKGFFSQWFDYRLDLKTDVFRTEFDVVINSLREEGDILHSRSDLAKYCYSTPQAKMQTEQDYYGVRVDTEKYSYLLRLNPNKGEYNLYCYCYRRDWLDQHLRQAKKGIRFITPHYKELFRIPDGDKIRLILCNGDEADRVCRYVDDYHVEVGDNLYHICEFAERCDRSGTKAIPLRSSLPERCYVFVESENRIGIISKGQSGYIPVPEEECADAVINRKTVEGHNAEMGVSKAQAEAMKAGSMFGWETPAADPKNYDANGVAIRPKHKDRGETR